MTEHKITYQEKQFPKVALPYGYRCSCGKEMVETYPTLARAVWASDVHLGLVEACNHPVSFGWDDCPRCWWKSVTRYGNPVLAIVRREGSSSLGSPQPSRRTPSKVSV